MYDLSNFKLSDAASCSMALRKTGMAADSMEEVAQTSARLLYENFRYGEDRARACALVRIFKTHPYEELNDELKGHADDALDQAVKYFPGMRCMVLLGTAGDLPEWNNRRASRNHGAIPLPSPDIVGRMPMVSQLLSQLGVSLATINKPVSSLFLEPEESNFGVFFIQKAEDSPFIPDQESFVKKYAIRSVIGFGSMLPSTNIFTTVIFSKVALSLETARLFKTFALSLKVALVPFDGLETFIPESHA